MIEDMPTDQTHAVLRDIVAERRRQIKLWGHNEDTPDGTGPQARSMGSVLPYSNRSFESLCRHDYELRQASGKPLTWAHFLREEFAEALCEEDDDKLYDELIQVAAVATSWCEKIRRRNQ